MPDMIYEGKVSIFDTDKDGNPLLTKADPEKNRPAKPYRNLSFQVDGEWTYLKDFEGKTDGIASGSQCRVVYYQPVDNRGNPKLWQGKPSYTLDSIEPLNGQPVTQNGPTATGAAIVDKGYPPDTKTQDIRRAVAIKAATELTCAMLPHLTDAAAFSYLDRVFEDAARIEAWLESGTVPNELDEMMAAAKDKLMDDVADDDADIPFG